MSLREHVVEQLKLVGDVISPTIAVATLLLWLPPLAAVFSIVWSGIQIYDWYKKKKKDR